MKLKKKSVLIGGLLCCILFIFFIMLGRALMLRPIPTFLEVKSENYNINEKNVVERLSKAIQYKTISYQDTNQIDVSQFDKFEEFLEDSYPNIHKNLQKEKINKLSLLYKWEGTQKNEGAILLMAHMDVVPADEGINKNWVYQPFLGKISNGYIWGRGALDLKDQLMGQFEAIEELISEGYKPKRTIYIALGHDEETGGINGNSQIASYLETRGVKISVVLDEGGFIVKKMVPGINAPIGVVGIAEKGYLTLELSATDNGGHSSLPPKHTAIGKLAKAITRLEDNPFETKIDGATKDFLNTIAPVMPFMQRFVFANMWLFKSGVVNKLSQSDNTNALLRTTIASTMIEGGIKENVLPQYSKALVNFRILPGESINSVITRSKRVINDHSIKIKPINNYWEPSIISSSTSNEFKKINKVARYIFPGIVVAPYLVVGSTDSRYYQRLTNKIYRFSPVEIDQEALKTIHGINEKISIQSYIRLIKFYHNCIIQLQN